MIEDDEDKYPESENYNSSKSKKNEINIGSWQYIHVNIISLIGWYTRVGFAVNLLKKGSNGQKIQGSCPFTQ